MWLSLDATGAREQEEGFDGGGGVAVQLIAVMRGRGGVFRSVGGART